MGVVYRATDLSLGRQVAIKTLPRLSRQRALRMRREARAMASVTHPSLALILGLESWQRLFSGAQAATLEHPALIIHDHDDDVVPCRQGQAFAQSWPRARILSTRGLGHRRVLRDPTVVQEVVRFVAGDMDHP